MNEEAKLNEETPELEVEPNDIDEHKRWIFPMIAVSLVGYAIGIGVGYSICKDTVKNAFNIRIF